MFGRRKKSNDPPPAMTTRPDPSSPASPAALAEIDDLRERLQTHRDRETELAFWRCVLGLPSWSFVTGAAAAADAINAGASSPPITVLSGEDGRMLPVFSTGDRAQAAGAHWERAAGRDGSTAIITKTMPAALAWVCASFADIPNLMFDLVPGVLNGFGTQIEALPGMYSHFHGAPPLACLPMMVRQANATQHPMALQHAYRVLLAQAHLWFTTRNDGSIAMMVIDDQLFVPVFTSEDNAKSFLAASAGAADVKTCRPVQILEIDSGLRQHFGERFGGVVCDFDTAPLGIRPDLYRAACDTLAPA